MSALIVGFTVLAKLRLFSCNKIIEQLLFIALAYGITCLLANICFDFIDNTKRATDIDELAFYCNLSTAMCNISKIWWLYITYTGLHLLSVYRSNILDQLSLFETNKLVNNFLYRRRNKVQTLCPIYFLIERKGHQLWAISQLICQQWLKSCR